jgi:hypothetical protein
VSYFSSCVGGTVTRQSKQKYSHTHRTQPRTRNLTSIIHAPSHAHTCVNMRLEEGATWWEEAITERGCAALEDTCSGRWCRRRLHRFTVGTDATRHVRQQRVGHDTHILPLPPDERQQGAACEGEGRRRERRGRGVFCPPRERLAGRRVAAEGAGKK